MGIDQPSTTGGHVDTKNGVMYRAPVGGQKTKKRHPPARLPRQFLCHVKRWRRNGCNFVVENIQGMRVAEMRKGWAHCKEIAEKMAAQDGVALDLTGVTPHTLRHTCATWLMQRSANKWDAAGFLGMSVETLERVYGHHHPDHQESAVKALELGRAPN